MCSTRHDAALPPVFWRVVAWMGSALVLLLTFTSVSPELHAWLHDRGQDHVSHGACTHQHAAKDSIPSSDADARANHECAVTLFAHGVVHHAATLLTLPCEGILRAVDYRAFERLALAQPRFLHLPPQAPPAV
jgi:hypothetical protein